MLYIYYITTARSLSPMHSIITLVKRTCFLLHMEKTALHSPFMQLHSGLNTFFSLHNDSQTKPKRSEKVVTRYYAEIQKSGCSIYRLLLYISWLRNVYIVTVLK